MVSEVAVESGCDYIVTFNRRDFAGVEKNFHIKIVTPREFLTEIGQINK